MGVYRVLGVHSETSIMQRYITAEDEESAVEKFIYMIKKSSPNEWDRMGEDNIFVKLKPNNRS